MCNVFKMSYNSIGDVGRADVPELVDVISVRVAANNVIGS